MLLNLLFIREMGEEDLLLSSEALTDLNESAIALHFNEIVDNQLDRGSVHIMDHYLIQLLARALPERGP